MALVLTRHSTGYDELLNTTMTSPSAGEAVEEAPPALLEEEGVDVEIELYMSLDAASAEVEEVVGAVVRKLQRLGYSVTVTPQVSYWGFALPGVAETPMIVVNGVVASASNVPGPEELFAEILAILAGVGGGGVEAQPFTLGPHRPSPDALAAAPVN